MIIWFFLELILNICNLVFFLLGSFWICFIDSVYFIVFVIWGFIGLVRIFGFKGVYNNLNWFFLFGFFVLVLVYIVIKVFFKVVWLRWVNMLIVLIGGFIMFFVFFVNNIMWFLVGMFFNGFIFRWKKMWWKWYNYFLFVVFDLGIVFMGILLWFIFD